jgi:Icc-related predicted phosphoesterase
MKLQIFSDLHTDVAKTKPIKIADDVDAVIVAGDVCEGVEKAFRTLRTIVPGAIPILFVAGNHEFYRRFIRDEIARARELASSFHIFFLERDTVLLNGVFFAGCTLWTDYCIFGKSNQAAVMNACARGMNDHRLIGWQRQPWLRFRPQEAALLHHQSREFLSEALATASDKPTVVIVHHGVHENSIHPRYLTDPLSGAFTSSVDVIQSAQPDLVVHGHVHHSLDYRIGTADYRIGTTRKTRVVCNPYGYGDENPDFDGALVVEVGS